MIDLFDAIMDALVAFGVTAFLLITYWMPWIDAAKGLD
jgi:hypothetical protein